MKKIFTIARHEFLGLVLKPAFWIGILGMPVITGVIMAITLLTSTAATAASAAAKANEAARPFGVVDQAGLINRTEYLSGTNFVLYPSLDAAKADLNSKAIEGYYIMAPDFVKTGAVKLVKQQFNAFDDFDKVDAFTALADLALLKGNAQTAKRMADPVTITRERSLKTSDSSGSSAAVDFPIVPFGIAMVFFINLISGSSYLMQTVTTEKETRVMEVLMTSATPMQLLAGKIGGFGFLSLLQLVLWLGSIASAATSVPFLSGFLPALTVPKLAAAMVYFIGGYLIYASAMAGLGALMPGQREASQYSILVMLPLLIPVYLNTAISAQPDGALSTALSLIPFTAPIVMPVRLIAGEVPLWQAGLGVALLVAAAYGVVWVSARLFRAQALLSGTKPSLAQIWANLRT